MAKGAKMQFGLASYAEVYCIICSLRRIVQAFPQMKPGGKCVHNEDKTEGLGN